MKKKNLVILCLSVTVIVELCVICNNFIEQGKIYNWHKVQDSEIHSGKGLGVIDQIPFVCDIILPKKGKYNLKLWAEESSANGKTIIPVASESIEAIKKENMILTIFYDKGSHKFKIELDKRTIDSAEDKRFENMFSLNKDEYFQSISKTDYIKGNHVTYSTIIGKISSKSGEPESTRTVSLHSNITPE